MELQVISSLKQYDKVAMHVAKDLKHQGRVNHSGPHLEYHDIVGWCKKLPFSLNILNSHEQVEYSHETSLDVRPDSWEDQAINFIIAILLCFAPADLFN